jgi:hypothetical protein
MSDHLSVQSRLSPKGGLHCFWCLNKTWTPPIDIFNILKITQNKLKLRKLWVSKVERVKSLQMKHKSWKFKKMIDDNVMINDG